MKRTRTTAQENRLIDSSNGSKKIIDTALINKEPIGTYTILDNSISINSRPQRRRMANVENKSTTSALNKQKSTDTQARSLDFYIHVVLDISYVR